MNKQEFQQTIKNMKCKKDCVYMSSFSVYQKGFEKAKELALLHSNYLDKPEKPVVPQFVADFYESIKDDFEYKVYELCLQYKHRGDELPQGVAWWFGDSRNKPIETLVMMHQLGYEVKKEKLYIAKNKQTGEYLCYCFEFFHDKNSSSENQRFTAEEKRWKELGYWGNDLYAFEEVEGEDE